MYTEKRASGMALKVLKILKIYLDMQPRRAYNRCQQ
jgi:hypothetical protein